MRKRWIYSLIFCLFLSGCSGINIVYNHFDTLAVWKVDDMFELNKPQKENIRSVANAYKKWFKDEYLPLLVIELKSAQQNWMAEEPILALERLDILFHDIRLQSFIFLKPKLLPIIFGFNQSNSIAYDAYLTENRPDWFESNQSKSKKTEKWTERYEDWFGHLTKQQLTIIHQNILWSKNEYKIRIDNSRYAQQRFISAALTQDEDEFINWAHDMKHWFTPEYSAWRQDNRNQVKTILAQLYPLLSEKQKSHAESKLAEWINIASSLE